MLNQSVELDIIVWLQSLGGGLEPAMKFFTLLGVPIVYIVLLPVLHWTISTRVATRVAIFLFVGGLINDIAKLAIASPRPFWVSPDVQTFGEHSGGFGMPSGHSQVAAPAWGYIVASLRRRWAIAAGVALAIAIGVSRIHLGAHFPSQVALGLALGGFFLWVMLRCQARVLDWLENPPLAIQIGSLVGATGFVTAAGYALVAAGDSWVVPADWAMNFESRPGNNASLEPMDSEGLALSAGSFLGAAIGAILQRRFIGWRCEGPLLARLWRLPVGFLVMAVPAAVVSGVFSLAGADTEAGVSGRLFGFALTFALFFGIFYLAPAVFQRLAPATGSGSSQPADGPSLAGE